MMLQQNWRKGQTLRYRQATLLTSSSLVISVLAARSCSLPQRCPYSHVAPRLQLPLAWAWMLLLMRLSSFVSTSARRDQNVSLGERRVEARAKRGIGRVGNAAKGG